MCKSVSITSLGCAVCRKTQQACSILHWWGSSWSYFDCWKRKGESLGESEKAEMLGKLVGRFAHLNKRWTVFVSAAVEGMINESDKIYFKSNKCSWAFNTYFWMFVYANNLPNNKNFAFWSYYLHGLKTLFSVVIMFSGSKRCCGVWRFCFLLIYTDIIGAQEFQNVKFP